MSVFASTTYLGRKPTSISDAIAGLADLGLDGIELGSTHVWEADLAQTVRRDWRAPILVHNYFPPARDNLILNIADTEEDRRRLSIEHAKECLAFAAEIGAGLYTVHPGFMARPIGPAVTETAAYDIAFSNDRQPHEIAFGLMLDALDELIDDAARAGVALAIETEGSRTSEGVLLMERPEEYTRLFERFPDGLGLNFNLAHTSLAAACHGFSVSDFIAQHGTRFEAVEISHNDGFADQHLPLEPGSQIFEWLAYLPDVPLILEFRNTSTGSVAESVRLLRAAKAGAGSKQATSS